MRGDVKKAQFVEMVISKLIRLKKVKCALGGAKIPSSFVTHNCFSIFLLSTFVVKKLSFKIKDNFAITLECKKNHFATYCKLL